MRKGWHNESQRHSLARRGIATGRKAQRESMNSSIAKSKPNYRELLTFGMKQEQKEHPEFTQHQAYEIAQDHMRNDKEAYLNEYLKKKEPNKDFDKDSVKNKTDCDPSDKSKQDFGLPRGLVKSYQRFATKRKIDKALKGAEGESERIEALEKLKTEAESKRFEAEEEREIQKDIASLENDEDIDPQEEELIEKKRQLKDLKVANQIKYTEQEIEREDRKLHKGEKSFFDELF